MSTGSFAIRTMNRGELDLAVDWAAQEGWNPGIHDADCFYATDPSGFFIGIADDKPAAMVSAVAYGKDYGFMGFYIVDPDMRDRGYGVRLWEAGLDHLGTMPVGLDSVRPDLVAHKKPEFKPAYTNFRFRWLKDRQCVVNPQIVPLANVPFPVLAAYDREVFVFERETFLKCWISRPGTVALGIMQDHGLAAYGAIRPCREGFKIGPLFADTADHAKALFEALTADIPLGLPVFLDTPEKNDHAVKLAQQYGMTEVFRTTRMYRGKGPDLPLHKWFGVTTFELG
jgi:GNAT superfamily N-acetyltransferase